MVLPPEVRHVSLDSDVYNICERVKEISPDLHIVVLANDEQHVFAIMEHCADGVERLVFKVSELDKRVLDKLNELMAVPLKTRIERLEKENHRFEQQEREREFEEFYETFGAPMWRQLEHDGFIESRGKSFPKSGVASKGKNHDAG